MTKSIKIQKSIPNQKGYWTVTYHTIEVPTELTEEKVIKLLSQVSPTTDFQIRK